MAQPFHNFLWRVREPFFVRALQLSYFMIWKIMKLHPKKFGDFFVTLPILIAPPKGPLSSIASRRSLSQDGPPWDPPSGVFRLAWVSPRGRSATICAFLSFVTQVFYLILPGNVASSVEGSYSVIPGGLIADRFLWLFLS